MMRAAWFRPIGGAAGDMILGSLLDAGMEISQLELALRRLSLGGYQLQTSQVNKGGISATQFKVVLDNVQVHRHHARSSDGLRIAEVRDLILRSNLPRAVIDTSTAIIENIASVRGDLERTRTDYRFPSDELVDTVVDVVGCAVALDFLDIDAVFSDPLPMGSGCIETRHGMLALPSPVAREIARRTSSPVEQKADFRRQVTVTGTAILATLAQFRAPQLDNVTEGYGAGEAEAPFPNVVHVRVGTVQ